MIQQQTLLKVSDNSGAKIVRCIKVLGGFKKKFARLGDIIIVSIITLRNKSKLTSKVKKGDVYKAVILRTKSNQIKKDGSSFSFQTNSVSLINKQGKPVATRIIGPFPAKLRKGKFAKFANISSKTI